MATRKAITLVSGLFQEVNTPTDKLDLLVTLQPILLKIQIYIIQIQGQSSYLSLTLGRWKPCI